jgi:hypothetical protein
MTRRNLPPPDAFESALQAIATLLEGDFKKLQDALWKEALATNSEMAQLHYRQKTVPFFRRFVPLRQRMSTLLAEAYRRFFKLAQAHPSKTEGDSDRWAGNQLRPSLDTAVEWIRQWYILACDGPEPSSTPWRAPSWLFGVSEVYFGIRFVYQNHLPNMDSDEPLGESHTRLLLKGARRVLLWDLEEAIERVRNEETAAAGAVRADAVTGQRRRTIKRKGWEKRLKLYDVIRTILSANPSLQGMAFCAELDKRHALPLLDWVKSGEWQEGLTWKEAWNQRELRRKIRRVRQEAQKAALD